VAGAAEPSATPGFVEKIEEDASSVEQTAKKDADAAATDVENDLESLESDAKKDATEAASRTEADAKVAEAEAKKLGEEGLRKGEALIKKEAPVVEKDATEIEKKAAALDRQWEPKIQRDVESDAKKIATDASADAAAARERISADRLWLAGYLHELDVNGRMKIDDELLHLNTVSPGLGTYAVDEMRYLERASQLEIKKGETDVDREASRVLEKTRTDLDAAGHWVDEEVHTGENELESDAIKAKRAVLAEENKADFWLEGRPLSDIQAQAVVAHNNLLVTNEFPSAQQCAECHPGQYRQWSVSQHAYAQLSPVFNSMSERTNRITNGTNGDFCIRCHNMVGMSIKEGNFIPNEDRLPVTREGISCIVCHRVKNAYGRVSGRFGIEKGNLVEPMYGPLDATVLNEVIDHFNVTTDPAAGVLNWKQGGDQVIHGGAVKVKTFATAQLCSNCHDVNSQDLFRLEEAYSQFRNSPAAAQGIICQDCHMGKILGEPSGYDRGPIAYIGGVPTPIGKRTNHMFAGPDYTIVHPGVFPHNPEAESIASFKEWLEFDIEAGWGTPEFESKTHAASEFPAEWQDRRHRLRAAQFLKGQLLLISQYRAQCFRTLRHGYQLGKFRVTRNDAKGLAFQIEVRNATNGHGASTGFDGEREVFLHVIVRDRDGKTIFESGDRDPNGDVRNLHSSYVRNEKVAIDTQLFSLQSEFLELMPHGGERERILPIPVSQGALPFLRPNSSSSLLLAHPTIMRKQASGIPPLGRAQAKYRVPAKALTGRPPYSVEFTFIAQMVPVNLVNEISSVGFDYNLSPRDVANRVVAGGFPLWHHQFPLGPAGSGKDLTPTPAEIMGPESVSPALPWLSLPQSWIRQLHGKTITADAGGTEQ
jgi:hypothetical protein